MRKAIVALMFIVLCVLSAEKGVAAEIGVEYHRICAETDYIMEQARVRWGEKRLSKLRKYVYIDRYLEMMEKSGQNERAHAFAFWISSCRNVRSAELYANIYSDRIRKGDEGERAYAYSMWMLNKGGKRNAAIFADIYLERLRAGDSAEKADAFAMWILNTGDFLAAEKYSKLFELCVRQGREEEESVIYSYLIIKGESETKADEISKKYIEEYNKILSTGENSKNADRYACEKLYGSF